MTEASMHLCHYLKRAITRSLQIKRYSSSLVNFNGVFAVNKPSGPSSATVVGQLKRAVNGSMLVAGSKANNYIDQAKRLHNDVTNGDATKNLRKKKIKTQELKVGHGGTLDPLASGVVVIGVGRGTRKLTDYLTNCTKVYEAVAMFGVSTTTYDSTGKIVKYGPTEHLNIATIQETIKANFLGEILQLPPIYSALKMNGKPLYEYAREGISLPRLIEPRKVNVHFFEIVDAKLQWDQDEYKLPIAGDADAQEIQFITEQGLALDRIHEMHKEVNLSKLNSAPSKSIEAHANGDTNELKKYPTLKFRFSVSSGTYIRSLIHDLAKAVGSTAHMTKLVRIQQGPFRLNENVLELEDIVSDSPTRLSEDKWVSLVETAIKQAQT